MEVQTFNLEWKFKGLKCASINLKDENVQVKINKAYKNCIGSLDAENQNIQPGPNQPSAVQNDNLNQANSLNPLNRITFANPNQFINAN